MALDPSYLNFQSSYNLFPEPFLTSMFNQGLLFRLSTISSLFDKTPSTESVSLTLISI